MRRLFSRQALNVFQIELEEWPHAVHTHNFYELILIVEGHGIHNLNDVSFPYKKGDVFLLTPEDWHEFKIESKTIFTYLKFTEQILIEKHLDSKNSWKRNLESELFKPNVIPENIIKGKKDKQMIWSLLDMLLTEFHDYDRFSREVVLELFGAVLFIIVRNLSKKGENVSKVEHIEKQKVSEMLSYIRQHLNDKEAISLQAIANKFLMSPNYVSVYLKKHTGIGLQQMIIETRLKTAERLLNQSTLTISEISNTLGFNDASHMNKMFKKYRNKTPKAYRNT
ncbi:AraC family transcriptional regulator [Formosa haliotis]|uniref:AraC family transcriptional regulator n=1 Tax=Formosa haliotis TaxID=1555194 RepID=UPI00082476F5|nr:AraC family transcriptional regulator [Formosa haliotis]